ncbi:MAG: DUF2283 domain-containing protein [Bacteroidota bacterium]
MDKTVTPLTTYDEHSDSLYIFAKKDFEEEVVELVPGVNIEYNKAGEVIGIEILRASRFFQDIPKTRTRQNKVRSLVKEKTNLYKTKKK